MKSQDNDRIDRALREALKRKFDEFETEVGKQSEDIIFNELKAVSGSSDGRSKLLLAGVLVTFFFLGAYFYFSQSTEKTVTVLNQQQQIVNGNLSAVLKLRPGPDTLKNREMKLVKRNGLITGGRNNFANHKIKSSVEVRQSLSLAHATAPGFTKPSVMGYKSVRIGTDVKGTVELRGIKSQPFADNERNEYLYPGNSDKAGPADSVNQRKEFAEDTLAAIDKRPYLWYHFNPDLRVKDHLNVLNKKSGLHKAPLGFVINLNPLSTVQVVTVKASSGVVYQNIKVPSELSFKRLGYKFSVGLTKSDFQLLFNYGQLNQSFSYEIASDEFELKEGSSRGQGFVPKGIKHQQNRQLKFVGLGIKRHSVISGPSAFQNYFGDIGFEVSRELGTKTNVMWGNLGIGKQLSISKNTNLTIGPYLEYSFTRMTNPDTKFQIRPYQLGLSIGLIYIK